MEKICTARPFTILTSLFVPSIHIRGSSRMYHSSNMASTSGHHYQHAQSSRNDRGRKIMSIDNLLAPQRSQMPVQAYHLQSGSSRVMSPSAIDSSFERTPREKREPYSDQAQFYIMYVRVGKEKDWNQIERSFEDIFGQHRAKDGLTAVYYRIRSKWGLPPVNKSSQEISEEGKDMIRQRARGFDQGFLKKVGYFEWCQSSQSSARPR